MKRRSVKTPVGILLLEETGGYLSAVRAGKDGVYADDISPVLDEAQRQIEAYFAGSLREFSLRTRAEGTAFETAVWQALRSIPCGQTRSYAQVAAMIGRPKAARAVGRACGRNPLLIVVPCHRVIASSGALSGFAGGADMKRALLAHEGCIMK